MSEEGLKSQTGWKEKELRTNLLDTGGFEKQDLKNKSQKKGRKRGQMGGATEIFGGGGGRKKKRIGKKSKGFEL